MASRALRLAHARRFVPAAASGGGGGGAGALDTFAKFRAAIEADGTAVMTFGVSAKEHFNAATGVLTDAVGGLASSKQGAGATVEGGTGLLRSADGATASLVFPAVPQALGQAEVLVCICSADSATGADRGFSLGPSSNPNLTRLDFVGGPGNSKEPDQTTKRPRLLLGDVGGVLGGEGDAYFAPWPEIGRTAITDLKVDAAGSPVRSFVSCVSADHTGYFGRCGAEKAFRSDGLPIDYYGQAASRVLTLMQGAIRLAAFAVIRGVGGQLPSARVMALADKYGVDAFGQTPSPAAGGAHFIAWMNSIGESFWPGIIQYDDGAGLRPITDGGSPPANGSEAADGIITRARSTYATLTGKPARAVNLGKSGYTWYWTAGNTTFTHDRANDPLNPGKHSGSLWQLLRSVWLRLDAEAAHNAVVAYEDINSRFYWGVDASYNPGVGPATPTAINRQIADDGNYVMGLLRATLGGTAPGANNAAEIVLISCGQRGSTDSDVAELLAMRQADLAAGTAPFARLVGDWATDVTLNVDANFHQPPAGQPANLHYNAYGSRIAGDLVAAHLATWYP